MKEPFGRIDGDKSLRTELLPYCRLKHGEVWEDEVSGHRVGVVDACNSEEVHTLCDSLSPSLAVHDPPYNVLLQNKSTTQLPKMDVEIYIDQARSWVKNTIEVLSNNSAVYFWLGADQKNHFQPLPEFMLMMREFNELTSKSFITLRNQRGYGTQKNWMSVRQECLFYVKGQPHFNIEGVYTDIPKVLKGYYKSVNGKRVENTERGKGNTIRAGNVWVDVQQVFYRLEENIPGCYAQKPLKSILRLIQVSSQKGESVLDFFSHSGTTLMAAELLERRAIVCDIDPLFAELTIRRLENYRNTGKVGFQCQNPFSEVEKYNSQELKTHNTKSLTTNKLF